MMGKKKIDEIKRLATPAVAVELVIENKELIAQRDELLAALKEAEPLVEQTVDISGYKTHKNRRVLIAVRAAIAKCEVKS